MSKKNSTTSTKTKITRIKAGEVKPVAQKVEKTTVTKVVKQPKTTKTGKKSPLKTIFKPLILFGRYLRDSWYELRQVKWPSRKATWSMTFAVIIYAALLLALVLLLDNLFDWVVKLLV